MFKDIKLNSLQWTKGQIKQKSKQYNELIKNI